MTQAFKTAAWIAVAGLLWAILEFASGLHGRYIHLHQVITWFAFIPILIIYISHYRGVKRRGSTGFKKYFTSGMLVTLFSIPLSIAGFLIFYYAINPHFFTAFREYTVSTKQMTQAEAVKYFNLRSYLFQIAAGIALVGVLASFILSFIFNRKK